MSKKKDIEEITNKLKKADRLLKNISLKLNHFYQSYYDDGTYFMNDIEESMEDLLEAKTLVNDCYD